MLAVVHPMGPCGKAEGKSDHPHLILLLSSTDALEGTLGYFISMQAQCQKDCMYFVVVGKLVSMKHSIFII